MSVGPTLSMSTAMFWLPEAPILSRIDESSGTNSASLGSTLKLLVLTNTLR